MSKPKFKKKILSSFLIVLALSTTSAILAVWTNYKNSSFAYDAGNVWYPGNIVDVGGDAALISWYSSWGKVKTDGYSFDIGTKTIKQVDVSLRALASWSWAEFYAQVYYNGRLKGTSGWMMINVGDFEYRSVVVDITDTYANPDNFVIYVYVAKTINDVWMDHIRVSVEY
ncbi:MAG: hypothetical protein ACFFFG_17760 [Candidatus Thorarchaeota archaeon]